MESKRLLIVLVVCCALVSLYVEPSQAQGLRWGREFEEEHPKLSPLMKEYLRRQEAMQKKREFAAKKADY